MSEYRPPALELPEALRKDLHDLAASILNPVYSAVEDQIRDTVMHLESAIQRAICLAVEQCTREIKFE
jgi:hypothetical protein